MTQDLNKGITRIQYNSLNLSQQMDIKSPVAEARNEYTYSAGGQKLKVYQKWNPNFSTSPVIGSDVNVSSMTTSQTTDYIGNKIYENGVLKRTLIDGGYIEGTTYHYYLTDHLGNNRVVANAGGTMVQKTHYYPFGMVFSLESTVELASPSKQPYKYNGKELDTKHGLNTYDYSARYYDPAKGSFDTMDPLAEKYYSISPYVYVANNPLNYVDYRGDSISVAAIQAYDQENGTNYLQTIISDLSAQTGLTYSVTASGMLVYNTDSNGNAIVSTTTDANGNVIEIGSQEGRSIMTDAISHTTTAYARITNSNESKAAVGGNFINLSLSQINGFINNSHGVDNRTLGWGMTFMHETLHSAVGGGLRDPASKLFGLTGAVVDRMNKVRAQLNAQGGNYGQRLSYASYSGVSGSKTSYLPFNKSTYNQMEYGINPVPTPSMQYIIYRKP